MSKTTFIINGVDVLEENKNLKEKLEQIKNAILYCGETDLCAICKFTDKCNGNIEEVILNIIEGAEDE